MDSPIAVNGASLKFNHMELMMNNESEIDFLLSHMHKDATVLEWGSGGSTIAIAKQVNALYSIEHDEKWYKDVKETIQGQAPHINYYLVARNIEEAPGHDGTLQDYFNYVNYPSRFGQIFDVIFIDGRARVECAKLAVKLLKPGGVILIHDYRNPTEKYRRYEYEVVEDFLTRTGGEYALHTFVPKAPATYNLQPTTYNIPMNTENATQMCWYDPALVESMNRFYDIEIKGHDLTNHSHLPAFIKLINQAKDAGNKLIDLGTGTAMITEFCKDFIFHGADLPFIISGCAMRNYPNYLYRALDILSDDIAWINNYDVVVANGFIDVMPDALNVFKKILQHAKTYLLLHRQEITENGVTSQVIKDSYCSKTYHSIINRADFMQLLDEMQFEVVDEEACPFGNWENGGSSFLLRRRKSWALNGMDHYLATKYFPGKTNGVFLEAGANDGLRQSNTMYFEHYKNWSGILIEPILGQYHQCRGNRSGVNIVVHAALVADDFEPELINMVYTPECNGLLSVVDNENADELLKRIGNELRESQQVPAKTLNEILQKIWHPGNAIDLAIIDVEGFELQALKGIDFKKWHIEYLLVEQLNGEDANIAAILAPHYDMVELIGKHDYLYKRKF